MKFWKKTLSVGLSLAMCASMVAPALAATLDDLQTAIGGESVYQDGQNADSTTEGADKFKIESSVDEDGKVNVTLWEDVEYDRKDGTTGVVIDGDVTINMNDQNILGPTDGDVITVEEDASLTINGGAEAEEPAEEGQKNTITGNVKNDGEIAADGITLEGDIDNNGTLDVEESTIIGDVDNSGTFDLAASTLVGNVTGNGSFTPANSTIKSDHPTLPESYEWHTIDFTTKYIVNNGDGSGNKEMDYWATVAIDQGLTFSYSYVIGGVTYEGTLVPFKGTVDENGTIWGAGVGERQLTVPVKAGEDTVVTVKINGLKDGTYDWWTAMYDMGFGYATTDDYFIIPVGTDIQRFTMWNYYKEPVEQQPVVTDRQVDIKVSFEKYMPGAEDAKVESSFDLSAISKNYTLTYSYVDPESGETVTKDLTVAGAGTETIDSWKYEGVQDHFFTWNISVPVGVDGIYLSLEQSNYDIEGYEWQELIGTNADWKDGLLFVSLDGNPAVTYLYNVYAVPTPEEPEIPDIPTPPTTEIDDVDVPLAGLFTRADAIGYLWEQSGSPEWELSDFEDVPEDHQWAVAIGWAQDMGIALPDQDG
ncbi:MAG: hypothetical protein K2M42_08965, partial [Oscillospiraceae bacterium]|nr:hypothetical protein [Oscillospiraceae bacterium]